MFELYNEPKIIPQLIAIFSILNTFLIWLIPALSFRVAYYFKHEVELPKYVPYWFAGIITFVGWLGLDINLFFIAPIYLGLSYICYKWISQKSIRWINISMLLFMFFIIATYAFFNYKLHYITYVFFSTNDILEYYFKFKPYFLIYHVGDFLGSTSFVINNRTVEFINEPLQYRIYVFYYGMNVIGLLTWLFIYLDVLKKHQFKFDPKIFLRAKDDRNKNNNNNKKETEMDAKEIITRQQHLAEKENRLRIKEDGLLKKIQQDKQSIADVQELLKNLEQRELDVEIKLLEVELKELKFDLTHHKVFKSLKTMKDLQLFMQQHVYCVWDFMSLLKRLQNEICSTTVPWKPIKNGNAAHLINSIVLGEESDKTPTHGHASHFELYIQAMKEIKADTSNIELFVELLSGNDLEKALKVIPMPAQSFVRDTLEIAMNGSLSENLGSFFNGRENVIPPMFSALLEQWSIDKKSAPMFHYYLVRHIELDADEHGPAAAKLIGSILGDNKQQYIEMLQASISSVQSRIELWDQVYLILEKNQ